MLLAPMEDVSDPPFRYVCKQNGADLMYTEFISSEGLIRDAAKSVKKLDIFDYERPVGIQFYGGNIESMKEATEIIEAENPGISNRCTSNHNSIHSVFCSHFNRKLRRNHISVSEDWNFHSGIIFYRTN